MQQSPGDERAKTQHQLAASIDRGETIDWERFAGDETLAGFRVLDRVAHAHRSIGGFVRSRSSTDGIDETKAPRAWGPFTLLARVGSGSFGEVYRAYDPSLEREVALKLRRPSNDLLNTRRHLEEARKLARVRHPGVLVVHGVDIHDGRVGLWTDFVQGRTLSERLAREGRLPPVEVARIGIELCRALAAIHAAGLVHGDLKAANVLIEAGSSRIVLVDFGSATLLTRESFSAQAQVVSGTPIAMAPELLCGAPPGPRSDLYALGVLLFRLLTERHPIGGRQLSEITAKHERGERLRLHEAAPEVPAALVEVVEHALAANPADRPGSAGEMEGLLAAVAPALGPGREGGRETLRALSARIGPLPDSLVRYLAREMAGELAAIHAQGHIHRDLSLDTIAIRDGRVVEILNEAPRSKALARDEFHAAPEVLQGEALADGRSDLFALGIVLHQLLTRRHPFPARDLEAYRRRVAKGWAADSGTPDLSPGWRAILEKLLAPDPRDRFSSAVDLGAALVKGTAVLEPSAGRRADDASRSAPHPRFCPAREPGFCGRILELGQLREAVRGAKGGTGRVRLVVGEEGSGKSRLLDELVQQLDADGSHRLVLAASCAPGAGDRAGPPLLVQAMEREGARAPSGISPETISNVLVEMVVKLAQERPTVLVLDDLHLAAESELHAFMSLARAARDLPLALIAAFRPEVDREWQAELERLPHAQSLRLCGLRDSEARDFLTSYLGSPDLAEEIEPELIRRSDGNPSLLLELLRGLEACGQIERLPDRRFARSQMAGSIAEIPLPESVSSSIRARLSRLSRLGRDVLEMASCSGVAFDPMLVGSALGIPPLMLFSELAVLDRDGWVVPTNASRCAFGSHHLREVIYGGLPATLRQANHLALAEAQERDLPVRSANAPLPGSEAVEVCTNFLRSGTPDRARPYLEPALEHLTARYDRRGEIGMVSDALASEDSWSDPERIALLLRRAKQLAMIGGPGAVTESFATALLLAEGTDDKALQAKVRIDLGGHLLVVGRIPAGRAILVQAVRLAESESDPALLARALQRAGQAAFRLGKYTEAIAECERALELALAAPAIWVACAAAKVLGDVYTASGDDAMARDFYQQGLNLARDLVDPGLEAHLANGVGTSLMNLGDWHGAESNFRRQIALAQKAGDAMNEGLGAGSLARMFLRLGRSAEAGKLWERQLMLARRYGYRRAEIAALGNLSMVRSDQGFLETARKLALDAVTIASAIGAPPYEQLRSQLIGVAIYGGDRDHALELLSSPSMEVDRPESGQIMRHLWMGLIAEHEENRAAAIQSYELALSHARTSGSRWQLSRALLTLGQILSLEHSEWARSRLEEARSIADEFGSRGVAVVTQAYLAGLAGGDLAAAENAFEAGKDHLSTISRMDTAFHLWRLTHRRSYLEEAHRILIHLRDHAPAEYRESILAAVPLHRQIREAWMQEVA